MNLSGVEIVKNYLERWKIESFFKMAKQELGLKDHEMLLKEKSKNATKKDTFEMIHDSEYLKPRLFSACNIVRNVHAQDE